jgi:hypothetical protein
MFKSATADLDAHRPGMTSYCTIFFGSSAGGMKNATAMRRRKQNLLRR